MQAKLKATYYLWQLFHAQQDSEQADKERAERQQLLTTAAEELQSIEAAVKDKKREVAGLSKQKILLEQKVKKRQAVVEKQVALPCALYPQFTSRDLQRCWI